MYLSSSRRLICRQEGFAGQPQAQGSSTQSNSGANLAETSINVLTQTQLRSIERRFFETRYFCDVSYLADSIYRDGLV